MKKILAVIFISLDLLACSPRFVVNGNVSRPSDEIRKEIREYWTKESQASLTASTVPTEKIDDVLELISFSELSINSECKNFHLLKIVPDEPKTFYVEERGKPRVSLTPQKYLEWWYVVACEGIHRWRVFDNPKILSRGVEALLYARP